MAQASLGTGITTNAYGSRKEYVINVADWAILGGVSGVTTAGDVLLEIFPAGTGLAGSNVEATTVIAGTSITDADVQLKWGATGSESSYGSSLDVDTATGRVTTTTVTLGSFATTNSLLLGMTTTGANISAISSGVIKVVVNILPPLSV